jgi:hypothetical protein
MCILTSAHIKAVSIIQDEALRLEVMSIFRAEIAPFQGEKIAGYIPIDRTAEHRRMRQLREQGKSIRAIAKLMGCAPRTVRKVVTF